MKTGQLLPNSTDHFQAATEALSMAILHSLWQGAIIGALLWATIQLIKQKPSDVKYWASVSSMCILFAMFCATASYFYLEAVDRQTIIGMEGSITASQGGYIMETSQPQTIYQKVVWFIGLAHDYATEIFFLWAVGALVFSLRFAIGLGYIHKLKNHPHNKSSPILQGYLHKLKNRMGIGQKVGIFESLTVKAPTIIGFFKPVVLLPMGLMANLPPGQLEAILAHELAHIKRQDYLANIIQSTIEVFLFYHPIVWWISDLIDEERENCCDDLAIEAIEDPHLYAKGLAGIAEMQLRSQVNQNQIYKHLTLTIMGKKGSIFLRIKRILSADARFQEPENKSQKLIGKMAAFFIIALFIAFFTLGTTDGLEANHHRAQNFPNTPGESSVSESPMPIGQNDTTKRGVQFKMDPIIILDGERQPDGTDINSLAAPSDIESVEVIKGEKAVDEYGTEGERGVVSIMLKASTELPAKNTLPEHHSDPQSKQEQADEGIKIRNREGGIENGDLPLFIVDGAHQAEIKMLSAEDIASIDVLKGESATDLYGEKGKNGVIIITTKKPKKDTKTHQPADEKMDSRFSVYPNPAASLTHIELSVEEAGYVGIVVYDVNGKQVATIFDGNIEKGKHRFNWDTQKVSPGIYFINASQGGKSGTQKQKVVVE